MSSGRCGRAKAIACGPVVRFWPSKSACNRSHASIGNNGDVTAESVSCRWNKSGSLSAGRSTCQGKSRRFPPKQLKAPVPRVCADHLVRAALGRINHVTRQTTVALALGQCGPRASDKAQKCPACPGRKVDCTTLHDAHRGWLVSGEKNNEPSFPRSLKSIYGMRRVTFLWSPAWSQGKNSRFVSQFKC